MKKNNICSLCFEKTMEDGSKLVIVKMKKSKLLYLTWYMDSTTGKHYFFISRDYCCNDVVSSFGIDDSASFKDVVNYFYKFDLIGVEDDLYLYYFYKYDLLGDDVELDLPF